VLELASVEDVAPVADINGCTVDVEVAAGVVSESHDITISTVAFVDVGS
jgi:hypothetical protein